MLRIYGALYDGRPIPSASRASAYLREGTHEPLHPPRPLHGERQRLGPPRALPLPRALPGRRSLDLPARVLSSPGSWSLAELSLAYARELAGVHVVSQLPPASRLSAWDLVVLDRRATSLG